MAKKRYGRIINLSSISAVRGNAGQANYCASRAGVIGMTLSNSKELGKRNITVNTIAPGFIENRYDYRFPPPKNKKNWYWDKSAWEGTEKRRTWLRPRRFSLQTARLISQDRSSESTAG